jgi:hypothetical protein
MIIKSVAALAFTTGVVTGAAGTAALSPDNFGSLTQMIGEPVSTRYRQCLNQKGWGHDLKPLSLREFCGVYVTSKYIAKHPVEPEDAE